MGQVNRYRMQSSAFYLFLILMLIPSCAPPRHELGAPVNPDIVKELITSWQERPVIVNTLKALVDVEVKAPLNNFNGRLVLIAEMPNRLRAETLSPFGFPILTVTVDGEQFAAFFTSENKMYLGKSTPENLGHFIHLPLDVEDLVGALLYQPHLLDAWKEEAFTLEKGGWLLSRRTAGERQELVFHANGQLTEVSFFDKNELVMSVQYDLDMDNHSDFPSSLTIEMPDQHAEILMTFTDVTINDDLRSSLFRLSPASSTKVIYWTD